MEPSDLLDLIIQLTLPEDLIFSSHNKLGFFGLSSPPAEDNELREDIKFMVYVLSGHQEAQYFFNQPAAGGRSSGETESEKLILSRRLQENLSDLCSSSYGPLLHSSELLSDHSVGNNERL